MSRLRFEKLAQDGSARRGRLHFPRGTVETPAFMPVGTYGTVKAMLPETVREGGAEIILGNTFHLFLRPGLEVIEAHGGLHGFCKWSGPILTDSGGFQVFSLAQRRKITEAGVTFAAPTDGSTVFLGPEESMFSPVPASVSQRGRRDCPCRLIATLLGGNSATQLNRKGPCRKAVSAILRETIMAGPEQEVAGIRSRGY